MNLPLLAGDDLCSPSFYKVRKGAKIRNRYNQVPHPGYQWESNKFTVRHHKREPSLLLIICSKIKNILSNGVSCFNKAVDFAKQFL